MTSPDPAVPRRPPNLARWLLGTIGFVGGCFVLIWALAVASDQGVGDLDIDDLNERAECALVDGQAQFTASIGRDELPTSADTLRLNVEFGNGGFPLELGTGTVAVGELAPDQNIEIIVVGPDMEGSPSCTVVDASVS